MAQRRFWNWKDDDLTFDLARTFIGLIEHGLYRGYDPVLGATMSLTLKHDVTGAIRVTKQLAFAPPYGIVVTKQGVIIQEDLELGFVINPTTTTARKDIIIVTHNYVDIEGGIEAVYSVIEGNAESFPPLSSPEKQEILGYLTLPPNTSALSGNGVVYERAGQPNFADHVDYIEKSGGFFLTALDAKGNAIINLLDPINDQDAATKFFVLQAIANSVVFSSEEIRGIVELATITEAVAGLDTIRAVTPAGVKAAIMARIANQEEVNSGTVDNKYVTPKTLQNRYATEDRKGIAAIATIEQAQEGLDDQTIITPYKLKSALPLTPVVVEIGNWDMQASAVISIAHNLAGDWNKVVSMTVTVRNDANTEIINLAISPNLFKMGAVNVDITADVTGLTITDFNATGLNRGYITLWLKKDIVPPVAYISVNAGSDMSLIVRYLKYATPVLTSITKTNSGYPSTLGTIDALVTLGAGTAGAVIDLQYQRADNVWLSLSSQLNIAGAPLSRHVTGQISDTTNVTGLYPVRAKVTLGGSIVMYTDTINTDMKKNSGFSWAGTGSSTTIYTPVPISGFVEAVGDAVDNTLWTVTAEPSAGAGHITPAENLNADFTADAYGNYTLLLTAETVGGTIASDSINVVLLPYVNHAPVISVVNNSAIQDDPNYPADYSIVSPSVYPYGKFTSSVEATDQDGDLLKYSIVQIASYSPITGAMGAPVEPPTVAVEQPSIYSNKFTVRGLVSTASVTPRPYYFKAVVDDGNGGIVEKGFSVNAPEAVPPPSTGYYFGLGTGDAAENTVLLASPYDKYSRFTAFVSVPSGVNVPQGSMAAFLRVGSGNFVGIDRDPSPIVVPVGVVTEIGSKMYHRPRVGGNALNATLYFEENGFTGSIITFRAYDLNNNLSAVFSVNGSFISGI